MKLDDLYERYFTKNNSDIKKSYNKYSTEEVVDKTYKQYSFICTSLLIYKNKKILWRNSYNNKIYSHYVFNCEYLSVAIL
jgi:hypothetical protein